MLYRQTGMVKIPYMKKTIPAVILALFCFNTYAQQHKPASRKKPQAKQHKTAAPAAGKHTVVPVKTPEPVGADNAAAPAPGVYSDLNVLEKQPEFSGGVTALRQYFMSNLQYPPEAQEGEIEGKVVVSFTVCEDGSLCDEQFIKRLGGGCDEEALRVIKKMPRWQPGLKDGKPVKVKYILPIMFHLQD